MPPLTKNLGLVKAIEVGTIPPTNVQMLWYDINLGQNLHKYYDLLTSSWVPLNLNSRSIIVDILYLDLLDLKNNNNLSENTTYRILDRADLGVIIKAISSNLLSVDGEGVFLNCDCQNVFGNNLGQWYSTLSGIVIGNVVRYLGIQYSSITGNVGTSPDGDIVNWFPIPKSTTTYILEVDIIKYDFNNDNIIYRADKRGNEVYKNISRFQWGNNNIKNNKDYSGFLTNINSRGSFDSVVNKSIFDILINETNTVNISDTEFGSLSFITFANCSGTISGCTFNTQDSLTITGAVSYERRIIYNNIASSFPNTLDMSDVAVFSANTITIPFTLRFTGSFTLLNNSGQVINKIIGMPRHNKVRFYAEDGNTHQFQLTLIGSAVDYHLVGDDALLITIIGRPDASDYIEFETSDKLNVVTKVNNKQTSLGFVPVNKAGDTMTGALILNADPVVGLGAVTKNYADSLVIGLLDDRGNYNPSTNSNQYPTTGGSGTAGAILKGDLWSINGLGSGIENAIGGKTVTDGDVIRALTNTPGQTDTNWVITENNFGYVAENTTNKVTTITGNETSITKFPAVKAIVDYLVATYQTIITYTSFGTFLHAATNKTTPVDADEVGIWDSVSGLLNRVSLSNLYTYIANKLTTATLTFTNKTIKPRIVTVTQSATPSINIDNGSIFQITGLAQAITSMTTNMTGTPYDGQCCCFEITDNGTGRAITLGSNFIASTAQALPTTTVSSVTLQIYTKYRSAISKHEVQFVN